MAAMTRWSPQLAEDLQRLYLEGAIDGVAIVAADSDRCAACGDLDGSMHMPSRMPRLPLEGCTRPGGCRCHYEPNPTVYE